MDERLAACAASQGGVFGSEDVARFGVSTSELTRMVRRREVIRIRRGAYVVAAHYLGVPAFDRYALRVKAVLRSRGAGERASHQSALALLGIGVAQAREDVVLLESPSVSRVRSHAGLVAVPASGGSTWLAGGFACVSPAKACVQVAAASGFVAGVCAMDSALFLQRCNREALNHEIARLAPRVRAAARRALEAVDPLAESVGESRTRIILRDAGFEVRSQVEFRDAAGFIGRVDLVVDDCVVVEFDGLQKYAAADGKRALAAEKAREERLSRQRYEVVRVVWSDLEDPATVVARVRRARTLARERRRAARTHT